VTNVYILGFMFQDLNGWSVLVAQLIYSSAGFLSSLSGMDNVLLRPSFALMVIPIKKRCGKGMPSR
jgi:ABC-type uncharacterized transport system permease subunit